jgi:hypothetical protein
MLPVLRTLPVLYLHAAAKVVLIVLAVTPRMHACSFALFVLYSATLFHRLPTKICTAQHGLAGINARSLLCTAGTVT